MWNGSVSQCQGFIDATGITYPMLQDAGAYGIGTLYSCGYDVSFVVDGDGVLVYRGDGFDSAAVSTAVDDALAALVSGVGDLPATRGFRLDPAYPNPFNPTTNIAWEIGPDVASAPVQVEILDVRGRRVARLLDAVQVGGRSYTIQWRGLDDTGRSVPSGTYLAAVTVAGVQKSRFITLIK